MCLPVELSPTAGPPRQVEYLHDRETEILVARIHAAQSGRGKRGSAPASVEIEGKDGSWLTLELNGGRIEGIAVAVWPPIRMRGALHPPISADLMHELVVDEGGMGGGDIGSVSEFSARVVAESDAAGRTVHFRLGRVGTVAERGRCGTLQTVRIAHDVMLEVDATRRIAGLWLLNLPEHSVPGS